MIMRKTMILLSLLLVLCFTLSACQEYLELPPSYEENDEIPFKEENLEEIESISSSKSQIQKIINNRELYPERLIESVKNNTELIDFALNYPEKKGTFNKNIDLSHKYDKGEFPLFIQWDEDWGYANYGQGVIGLDGCGPTCLSMVYVALTGDQSMNPQALAEFSTDNGYIDTNNDITLWTLMSEGAEKLGLKSEEIPLNENIMIRELSEGHPIITSMGPGDFTTTGHFIVIYDYIDGHFLIKDPNSRSRSQKKWSYSTIEAQIKNLWAFSK